MNKSKKIELIIDMLQIIALGDYRGTVEDLIQSMDAHFDIRVENEIDEVEAAASILTMKKIISELLEGK